MSWETFSTGSYAETALGALMPTGFPWVLMAWTYPFNASAYDEVFGIQNGVDQTNYGNIWQYGASTNSWRFIFDGGDAGNTDTPNGAPVVANKWVFLLMQATSASDHALHVGQDGAVTKLANTTDSRTPAFFGNTSAYKYEIAAHDDGSRSNYYDGRIQSCAVWDLDDPLSDAEIQRLAMGLHPMDMKRNRLIHFWDLDTGGAGLLIDHINGDHMTEFPTGNGVGTSSHGPVRPRTIRRFWSFAAAAAGVTINTNLGTKSLGDQGQATGLINALDALAKLAHAVATGPHSALAARSKATFDVGHGHGTGLDTLSKAGQGAGTGHGTVLDSLNKSGLAQIAGLVSALEARTIAESGQSTGLGTALDSLTKAGHSAGVGSTPTIVTSTDSLTHAGQAAGTGHGTALAALTKLGHAAGVGSVVNVATQLATLSKAGQGAALGLISALDSMSITDRGQALGLITSTASETITEFPVNTGGAGFTTNLATLSRAGLAAGVTLWQLGDAIKQAYFDLDVFFDQLGDIDVLMDSEMGWAETVSDGSNSFPGIFDDHSVAGAEPDGPKLMVRTSDRDAYDLTHGKVLTIRGRTFHVAGPRRDGTGLTTLVLTEVV